MMNERPTARAMMIPIAFVEFSYLSYQGQKINAVKIKLEVSVEDGVQDAWSQSFFTDWQFIRNFKVDH